MNLSVAVDKINSLDEAKLLIHELMALHQAEIESHKAAIAELQQKQGLSSRNSSKAPSTDLRAQRGQRKQRAKSARAKGAQPGHTKHEHALLLEDQVDTIHRYFPEASCQCGSTLTMNQSPTYRML